MQFPEREASHIRQNGKNKGKQNHISVRMARIKANKITFV
jgi:hypothetical protein